MTHLGSTRIRRLAASLPLTAIVLETDAPDMSPAWLAGARNTPAELPRINAVLAELRGIDAGRNGARDDGECARGAASVAFDRLIGYVTASRASRL
jgi:hypothetical protein